MEELEKGREGKGEIGIRKRVPSHCVTSLRGFTELA